MHCARTVDLAPRRDGEVGRRPTVINVIIGMACAVTFTWPLFVSWVARAQSVGEASRLPQVRLLEEDVNDQRGRRFDGTVTWSTERVTGKLQRMNELAIRADIEIPDRKLGVMVSLQSETDPLMTHVFTIVFRLPLNFLAGGIMEVPGILMKEDENIRGAPLRGHTVKVADGFFMIGLSRADEDRASNLRLLKTRPWFDIPIRYSNNRRAILAVEKGASGERVFAEASATWGR